MVVVELAGEEPGPGETVVLRAMVPVVLVRADRMSPESVVLGNVEREPVVVAEEDRLAVLGDGELRRHGAIEGPHRVQLLGRQARMEAHRNGRCRVDARIVVRGNPRVVGGVSPGPLLRHLNCDPGRELSKALMRPDRARGTPFDGTCVAGCHTLEREIQKLLGGIRLGRRCGIQEPGFREPRQDIEAGHGLRERLHAEQRAARGTGRDTRKRAAHERVQAIRPGQRSKAAEDSPLDQIAARDLPDGARLDDLEAVPAGIFRFPQPEFRRLLG